MEAKRHLGFFSSTAIILLILCIQAVLGTVYLMNTMIKAPGVDSVKFKGSNLIINNGERVTSLYENFPVESLIFGFVATLAILALVFSRKSVSAPEYLQFRKVENRHLLFWLLASALWLLISGVLSENIPALSSDFAASLLENEPSILKLLLAAGILGPATEEILFRGLLFKSIEKGASANSGIMAVAISALLFSMVHFQYNIFILAFIFLHGLLLGAARLQTQSIITPILMHCLHNTFIFSYLWLSAR